MRVTIRVGSCFTSKYKTMGIILTGKNTLAYLSGARVTKKKSFKAFKNCVTWSKLMPILVSFAISLYQKDFSL